MGGKRLRQLGASHVVRLRLSEYEEEIVRLISANGCRIAGVSRKPTYAQTVAALVRLGLQCLRDHGESEYEPEPISEAEAQALKLNWPGKNKRPPVINSRPVNLWRPQRRPK